MYIINPNSLAKCGAKEALATDIETCNASIVLVSETHFKLKHDDAASAINGFNCFRRDRTKRKCGGVCIYTRHELNASQVNLSLVTSNTETLWVRFVVGNQSVYICCCYHPPKFIYKAADLLMMLCANIDEIMSIDNAAVVIIAGDLNKLNCSMLENDYGLTQMVNQATRKNSVLDKYLTNRPDLITTVSVIQSLVRSDHKAVVVNPVSSAGGAQRKHTEHHTAIVYDKSPEHIANLCEALGKYSWNALISAIDCGVIDANEAFDDFY